MEISVYAIPGCVKHEATTPSQDKLYVEVCELYKVTTVEADSHQKSRVRKYVEIRQTVMALTRLHWGEEKSLSDIGGFFGKDHATALHAIKTIKNLRETDRKYRELTDDVFKGLKWPKKFN